MTNTAFQAVLWNIINVYSVFSFQLRNAKTVRNAPNLYILFVFFFKARADINQLS